MEKFKWLLLVIALTLSSIIVLQSNIYVHAAGGWDDFSIIKKTRVTSDDLKEIWSEPWKVMDKYKKAAAELDGEAWEQLGSWIMSRNTIYNYLIFFVQYLSQLGLIVWVLFIIYAWYKYMTSVFTWKSAPTDVLSNAIIWVLIVIFSYAITKLLTWFIWLS